MACPRRVRLRLSRALAAGCGKLTRTRAGLDSYALGAGVRGGARPARDDARSRAPEREGQLAWAPRVEASPPRHAGTWSFGRETGPDFVADVRALVDAAARVERKRQRQTGAGLAGEAAEGGWGQRADVAVRGQRHDELTRLQGKTSGLDVFNVDTNHDGMRVCSAVSPAPRPRIRRLLTACWHVFVGVIQDEEAIAADKRVDAATKSAVDWQQRVTDYYKKEMAEGRYVNTRAHSCTYSMLDHRSLSLAFVLSLFLFR